MPGTLLRRAGNFCGLLLAGAILLSAVYVPGAAAEPSAAPNFLHTEGAKIVDSQGKEVIISGVNWFGMETNTLSPHGLWARSLDDMLDQIAELGYNTIRLPFSNEIFNPDLKPTAVDYRLNPELENLSALELLDRVIAGAGKRGIKVLLDRHRSTTDGQDKLWYNEEVSEEKWIADWQLLAARYKGNDTVIAVDLSNEPRGAATWGTGDQTTDWRLAAERAGNAVLEENPYLLIFVEGVGMYDGQWYWFGGNLSGAGKYPVRLKVPNRVVYSPHDYGPSVYDQAWLRDPRFPANLAEVWDRHWGYIQEEGIAPVVVGEFGGRSVGADREGQWHRTFLAYIQARGIGGLAWSLNPNDETGGIFSDDWQGLDMPKQELYWRMLVGPSDPATGQTGRLRVLFRQVETAEQARSVAFAFRVVNTGPDPVDLDGLELRYWLAAGSLAGREQVAFVTGEGPSATAGLANFFPTSRGGQSHYLRVRFGSGAGTLGGYRASDVILVRFHRTDLTQYFQPNDYSFAPLPELHERFGAWARVTLYQDGRLVWGHEPAPRVAWARPQSVA